MKHSLSAFASLTLLLLAACSIPQWPAGSGPGQARMGEGGMVAPSAIEPPKGSIPGNLPILKVALLVPLSGDSVAVGNAMLDAATMALSDNYFTVPSDQIHAQIILLPKDTGNIPADTAKVVDQALAQGANFIIGPLFSQSVSIVAPTVKQRAIPMLTFSNNRAVAGGGIYTFGFLPEQQVTRIAEYAYLHNLQRVALLVPNDSYGEKVKETLTMVYGQKGGWVQPIELYAPSPANIDAAVARMANTYNNLAEDRRFQAIFVADGGNQLKTIIGSLQKNHIDLKKVKLLGTGLWDDPEIAKIPEMEGAWFPSSPPEPYQMFEKRFIATYGYKPVRLASLAYDAVTLVARLAIAGTAGGTADGIDLSLMINPDGFNGPSNGLFRLNPDGTSERRLAVMEVTPEGFKVIDPALRSFAVPGARPGEPTPMAVPQPAPEPEAVAPPAPAEETPAAPEAAAPEATAPLTPEATPPSTGSAPAAP